MFCLLGCSFAWEPFPRYAGPIEKSLFLLDSGIPKRKATASEVLVEVYSTALNPIDYKILELGIVKKMIFRSPVTPGLDVCGPVVEIGSKVDSFRIGDIVYGSCNGVFGHGALAQFAPVPKDALALVPKGLKADDMVSIATVGMTTYQGLKPHIKAGDRIFINGGSGGTGVVSIQIAKALGCHVTTSCSAANVGLCKSLGADEVLDYKSAGIIEQLKGKGQIFDLILDNVGSPFNLYRVSHTFIVPDGNFIQVGMGMSLSAIRQLIGNMMLPGFLGGGKRKYVLVTAKANSADVDQLAEWMEEGKIRAVIDSTFEFNATPKAFERLKMGRARGKVVVHVKES
ncbi:reticulon-4-interacting protein 1, mitochondrial precursor [Zopfia rhizophila CBS 207.26]|uniref:Reticulon-4-interacting protein 1, mitochondrial n=1 Tax=Zopfia rhizophila CBS 207.26 TaxID=1314779 RepID=A0A6A6E6K9_9PEZI|nr:reticulon-4-interacting protein 1, mitochondrial precursor [Zopfia rhizophila CBS 207.26]